MDSPNYVGSFSWTYACRIGEASNPGPARRVTMHVRNIASAAAHIDELQHSQDDILFWTETSATAMTIASLKTKAKSSKFSLVASAPTGARHNKGYMTSGRGEASGALVSSKFPLLDLNGLWSDPVFQTGRIADSIVNIGGVQIRLLSIYGYHSGISNHLGLNEILTSHVLVQASSFNIPTFIAGDFNHSLHDSPNWPGFRASGFVDLASKFATLAGTEPEYTYRGKSRIDYVLANPMAEAMVDSFRVDPRGFTDHASLHVTLYVPCRLPQQLRWQMPVDMASIPAVLSKLPEQSIPYNCVQSFCSHVTCNRMDEAFQDFCTAFETACSTAHENAGLGCLPPKLRGRGRGKLVKVEPARFALSAKGDVLTDQHLFRRRQKLIRQVRELAKAMCKAGGRMQPEHVPLWSKILRSDACPGGFQNWILANDLVLWIPEEPDMCWMGELLDALLVEEGFWKAAVKARQALVRKERMDTDWSQGGSLHAAALKPAGSPPLTAMAKMEEVHILPLRTVKGTPAKFRQLDGPQPFPGTVWKFSDTRVMVTRVDTDVVTVSKPFCTEMWVKQVSQLTWTSDPDFMADAVMRYWKSFWSSERPVDMDFVKANLSNLPELEPFEPSITAQELNFVISKLPRKKSRGLEGFSYSEIKSLGPELRSMLLLLLNQITQTAQWPSQLCTALVTLLAKTLAPAGPSDARPIAVLSSTYRLWAKCITLKVVKHLLPALPCGLFGSAPGKSALDIAWLLQSRLEESIVSNSKLTGVSMDLPLL